MTNTSINIIMKSKIKQTSQKIPNESHIYSPNAETIKALREIETLKKNPSKKTYSQFKNLLDDL